MPLSTSNSKPGAASGRIVFRSLALALVILLGYCAAIRRHVIPASDGATQWQSNIIRAQRYHRDTRAVPALVLVGSSLTDNIRPLYLGPNAVNLGFSGGTTETGLQVIARSEARPQVVAAEINDTIVRGVDDNLVSTATDPALTRIYGVFPMFGLEYQPVSVLIDTAKKRVKRRLGSEEQQDLNAPAPDPALHARLVGENLKTLAAPLTPGERSDLTAAAARIKIQIAILKARGIRVVLHAIPGDPETAQALKTKETAALLRREFPDGAYEWLAPPPPYHWITGDGIHLIKRDAGVYGRYLRKALSIHSPQPR